MPDCPAPRAPRRRAPLVWWRLDVAPDALLTEALAVDTDARVAADWLLARSAPWEVCVLVGNRGPWAGLHLGLTGLAQTEARAMLHRDALAAGFDDAPDAFGWPLRRTGVPGPLPRVGLPVGVHPGERLSLRDGFFDRTRCRLLALDRADQTAVLRLALRVDPPAKELRREAKATLCDALRRARPPRTGRPLSSGVIDRARDLWADLIGVQAELSLHVDAVPGPLSAHRLLADLAHDVGAGVRWDLRNWAPARPELLPGALTLLSASGASAEPLARLASTVR